MSRPDTAMIFAAGRGTRMRELTQHRPKPMIPLAGRPLIDHALDRVAEAGLRRAVVNTHYLPDALEAHLAQETRFDIALSHEPTLLETGGGLKKAAPLLRDGPVWTLNADAAWAGPSPFAAPDLHPVPGGACLLLVPKARAFAHPGRGDFFLADDGRLDWRGEAESAPYVYVGLQIIDPAPAVDEPEEVFSLHRIWEGMRSNGKLTGAVWEGRWCDVGQPESLAVAEAMLADG